MKRFPYSMVFCFLLSVGKLPAVAQDDKALTMSELQAMVLSQQKMLEDQSQLIEEQSQALASQQEALTSLRAQVDQLSIASGVTSEMTPEEIALMDRINRVEEQLANPPDTPENVLTAGEFPNSIRIPGTNMSGKVGGFVRLGTVSNFAAIGSDDRFVVGTIPVGDEAQAGEGQRITISAKRSRLNLDMRMDSSVGQFRAFIEGDFASGSDDNYRLRHAYGQYKRHILGQTWSTLMDKAAEPEELDFEGLNAELIQRQPLWRWTRGLGHQRLFALGLEDPSPDITGGEGISRTPDLAVRLTKQKEWGHLQAGLLLRSLTGESDERSAPDTLALNSAIEDSALGWGLTTSGNIFLKRGTQRDNLKFQISYGEGMGRYINDLGTVGGKDAVFDPTTFQLEPYPVFAGYVAYQHWWRRNPWGLFRDLRSTLVYGRVDIDNFDFEPEQAYDRTVRTSVNLIWSPIAAIDLGVEYLWGRKWEKNGTSGNARQLQLVGTFRF